MEKKTLIVSNNGPLAASLSEISSNALIKVEISYPKEYEGPKLMHEGREYNVSPETAEILINKGIASIVDGKTKQSSASEKSEADDSISKQTPKTKTKEK